MSHLVYFSSDKRDIGPWNNRIRSTILRSSDKSYQINEISKHREIGPESHQIRYWNIVRRTLTGRYEQRITNLCNNLWIRIIKILICLSHLRNWSIIIRRYFTFQRVFNLDNYIKFDYENEIYEFLFLNWAYFIPLHLESEKSIQSCINVRGLGLEIWSN